ncbi:molybdenum cofactor synthesis 1 [Monoraphidium neglectum]|uniref:cyclic pyranopterin monophosphate synthase n=1 Tax=Monoraphidium neglectum TaxID=145388 RepID=A0A0D2NCX4_9CHLO|nr:molybdenum cofactor synthesis 1 [Monoraphidium neglectum]KIZ03156.1 molybdenum cofactor synthesis 1 [Monoraphidium neglectum]|eukprot:XP_013902175.1 molybdenum cofactor synthesis 1 [Monoraphidium neglectum]
MGGTAAGGCAEGAPARAAAAAAPSLTHVDGSGRAAMVDVGGKDSTAREARASCRVLLGPEAFALVQSNSIKKGDVLTVAQLAGVMGAKHTALLIPLCHSLLLSKSLGPPALLRPMMYYEIGEFCVDVSLQLDPPSHAVRICSMARTVGQTGVEMEALTAAAVAALTVYDMCKAVAKDACITDLRLDFKSGGKSGTYAREAPP